LSLITRLF